MNTNEEKEAGMVSALASVNNDIFKVKGVQDVNHSLGHAYTIGTRHIKYASDNHGGMLGDDAIKAGEAVGIRCAHPKCGMPMDDHTSEKVCFLQLMRNCTNEEASKVLQAATQVLGPDYVHGFAFVETDEGYRIGK